MYVFERRQPQPDLPQESMGADKLDTMYGWLKPRQQPFDIAGFFTKKSSSADSKNKWAKQPAERVEVIYPGIRIESPRITLATIWQNAPADILETPATTEFQVLDEASEPVSGPSIELIVNETPAEASLEETAKQAPDTHEQSRTQLTVEFGRLAISSLGKTVSAIKKSRQLVAAGRQKVSETIQSGGSKLNELYSDHQKEILGTAAALGSLAVATLMYKGIIPQPFGDHGHESAQASPAHHHASAPETAVHQHVLVQAQYHAHKLAHHASKATEHLKYATESLRYQGDTIWNHVHSHLQTKFPHMSSTKLNALTDVYSKKELVLNHLKNGAERRMHIGQSFKILKFLR